MSRAYGWTADNRIDKAEATELRRMAEEVIAGTPIRALAASLTERGISTVSGKPWASMTIKRALTNPRILGATAGIDGARVTVPAILKEDTYDKLVEILDDPARKKFAPKRGRPALLSGIARCAVCNGPMHLAQSVDRAPNYRCSSRDGCNKVVCVAEHLDADATERVLARLTDLGFRGRLEKAVSQPPDVYQQQINDAESRIVVLSEEFGGAGGNPEAFKAGVEAARDVIATARRNLDAVDTLGALPGPSVDDMLEWWEASTVEEKRAAIRLFLDHVLVKPRVAGEERYIYEWR